MPRTKKPSAAALKKEKAAKTSEKRSYGAPALEKGLDVLELLAGLSRGVSQSEIAQLLGRSLQEVYRVVMVLERRGYIQHRPGEDGYFLSNRTFDLAHRYPPLARLIDLATPMMNAASVAADQAMHIAILDKTDIRVVAQIDSPAPLGFRLRVGTKNPAMGTCSGRLLVAFQPPTIRDWVVEEMRKTSTAEDVDTTVSRIDKIRARGYEMVTGEQLQGITDVSFPLIDGNGYAQAVLTMPFLRGSGQMVSFDAACEATFDAAQAVTGMLGGNLVRPRFPLARIMAKRPPTQVD